MEFSRQEYWSGLSFPCLGHLPDPGIKPESPSLQADSLPSETPGSQIQASMVKYPPASAEVSDTIPGLGRSPGEENGNPSSILAWKSRGQRSLVGYSPWGCKRVRHDLATKQQRQS